MPGGHERGGVENAVRLHVNINIFHLLCTSMRRVWTAKWVVTLELSCVDSTLSSDERLLTPEMRGEFSMQFAKFMKLSVHSLFA